MAFRSVVNLFAAQTINMGGTLVKQALPTQQMEQISPFLLLHHFGPTRVEVGTDPLGVGPHPHRGFEPVTFLYSGGIRHKDSRGNEGILEAGDVQWMTAGRGIIHSEMASHSFLEQGGTMEGVQLWINLPKSDKMVQPKYQEIKAADIPVWTTPDGASIKVVAGKYEGLTGPATTHTPLLALQISLPQGSAADVPLPKEFNAFAYILKGETVLNDNFGYEGETLIHFNNDGDSVRFSAKASTELLLLAGTPIDEPVAQWGPYVMNTQTEIMEAMRDYQMGKMGVYID